MRKAEKIKKEDIEKLLQDENGDFFIPDHVVIYIRETEEEKKQKRIAELEEELSKWKEPTQEELIEYGMVDHPYYQNITELEQLKK